MGSIKHQETFSNSQIIGVTLLVGTLFLIMVGMFNEPKPIAPEWKYNVCVTNWVGTTCTPCMSYKRVSDGYILFDEKLDKLGEIMLTEGYVAKVRKYNE